MAHSWSEYFPLQEAADRELAELLGQYAVDPNKAKKEKKKKEEEEAKKEEEVKAFLLLTILFLCSLCLLKTFSPLLTEEAAASGPRCH